MQFPGFVSRPGRLLLLAFVFSHQPIATAQSNPAKIEKTLRLPLVEIPATAGYSDCFAILFSGDGGWSRFDQNVCGQLASHGMPVLGLNSLKYLWTAKTPEQITLDLMRLIELGQTRYGKQKVVLAGYSCGANLIPFAYNRLNDAIKAQVQYVALLSPEDKADFEFHFYNWVDKNSSRALSVRPELEKMRAMHTLFIYGDHEDYRWCSELIADPFVLKTLPGGHHFGWSETLVANEILQFQHYFSH